MPKNMSKLPSFFFVFFLCSATSLLAEPHRKLDGDYRTGSQSAPQRFEDIGKWAKEFEDPARDAWQKPDEVIKALEIKKGSVVYDVGAGTGYFTRRFAKAVTATGKAIGMDVEASMVEYMTKDAAALGLPQYEAKLVSQDDPKIPPGSADLIFLCDSYHHLANRTTYLNFLVPGLKPDGRIVIVDFFKKPLPIGPRRLEHKLSEEEVESEFAKAGLVLKKNYPLLPHQYILEFSKPEPKPAPGKAR